MSKHDPVEVVTTAQRLGVSVGNAERHLDSVHGHDDEAQREYAVACAVKQLGVSREEAETLVASRDYRAIAVAGRNGEVETVVALLKDDATLAAEVEQQPGSENQLKEADARDDDSEATD